MKITLLKKERLRHNMSQKELGECVGLSKSAISMMELGNRNPSYSVMLRLADVLDVPGEKLLDLVEEDSPLSQK